MRKLALALLSAAAVYGLTGCALTDYCDNDACTDRVGDLLEDGTHLGCASASLLPQGNPNRPVQNALGLSQFADVIVPDVETWEYCGARLLPANVCESAATFGPPVCANPAGLVGHDRAGQWMQEGAAQAFIAEAQVFGGPASTGTWVMGGVKSLHVVCDPATGDPVVPPGAGGGAPGANACGNNGDKVLVCHRPPGNPDNAHTLCVGASAECAHLNNHEGDTAGPCGAPPPPPGGGDPPGWKTLRLTTWGARGVTGNFSCMADQFDGNAASTEGELAGEGFPGGHLEGLKVEAISLDNGPSINFGRNLRAWAPVNNGGFNVFLAVIGRAGEGRHNAVLPSAGLEEFLSGGEIEFALPGIPVVVTLRGDMGTDGLVHTQIVKANHNGNIWTGNPANPVDVAFSLDGRRWAWGRPGDGEFAAESRKDLVRWYLATVPNPEGPWDMSAGVPALGMNPGPIALQFDPINLANWANN